MVNCMETFDFGQYLNVGRMTLAQMRKALGFAVYVVEPELVSMARHTAELLMKRYETEKIPRDWDIRDKQSIFYGLLGEEIFKATLYQLRIPHLHTHALYSYEIRTPHDFEVNGKTIQVKTIRFGDAYKNLVIKKKEWTHSDIAVPIKLVDKELTQARIFGFLTGNDVESLSIADGTYPCPYQACYHCLLSEVTKTHTAYELFEILKMQKSHTREKV
jgi:hypothetical protein